AARTQVHRPAERLDLVARDLEERLDPAALVPATWLDTCEPLDPGPPQEVEQNRLGLIVERVPLGDPPGPDLPAHVVARVPPRAPLALAPSPRPPPRAPAGRRRRGRAGAPRAGLRAGARTRHRRRCRRAGGGRSGRSRAASGTSDVTRATYAPDTRCRGRRTP